MAQASCSNPPSRITRPMLVALVVHRTADDRPTQTQAVPPYARARASERSDGAPSASTDISGLRTPFLVGHVRTSSGATRATWSGMAAIAGSRDARRRVERARWATGWAHVVGQAQTASLQTHAFRRRRLGTPAPSDARPISGRSAGTWSAAYGTDYASRSSARRRWPAAAALQAFIWTNGVMSARAGRIAAATASPATSSTTRWSATRAPPATRRAAAFWLKEGVVDDLPSLGGNSVGQRDQRLGDGSSASRSRPIRRDGMRSCYDDGDDHRPRARSAAPNSEALDINGARRRGRRLGSSPAAGPGPSSGATAP